MQYLSYIYLIMLCSILPLYMKSGYYELGEAKAGCYLTVSLCFFVLIGALEFFKRAKNKRQVLNISIYPQFFACGLLLSSLLSFVFSVDKKTAFFGYVGWRNGLLTTLLYLAFMVIFTGYSYDKKWTILTALIVPTLEFILGIADRMGVYLFAIPGRDSGYIATIGNINWYAGFLAIFVPVGMGLVFIKRKFDIFFFMSAGYTVLGFIALFLQGSDGAGLIIVASFLLLLWIAIESWESIKSFLMVVALWGTAMTVVDIMMSLAGDSYNYDANLLLSLCTSHNGIIILAAAFFLYRLVILLEEIKVEFATKIFRLIYPAMLAVAGAAALFWVFTNYNDDFGNGRGIIWRMCRDIFLGLPDWQKMVGVGQDCLYYYVSHDEMWSSSFYSVFGQDALTNAHCEILTALIERGFVGTVCYVGLFISVISGLIKAYKKERAAVIYALPVISYFVFTQVSFAQVMSTPYVFILMGLGMSLIQSDTSAMSSGESGQLRNGD